MGSTASALLDRNLSKFDDNKRGLARLMARENITVQILDNVATATFDVATRVLTLPNWPLEDVNQLDTLIAHEVGHALFTDFAFTERFVQQWTDARQRKDVDAAKRALRLKTYVNIVEDARIERRMRDSYAGMQAVFFFGYRSFTENGPIFRVSDRRHLLLKNPQTGRDARVKIATLPFIDRINLHYKIGAFVDVPFSTEEQPFLARIDHTYSTENACEVAEAIYDFVREQNRAREEEEKRKQEEQKRKRQEKRQQEKRQKSSDAGDGDGDSDDADEGDDDSKPSKKQSKQSTKKDQKRDEDADAGDAADEDSDASGDDADDSKDANGSKTDEDTDADADSEASGDDTDDSDADGEADGGDEGEDSDNGADEGDGTDEGDGGDEGDAAGEDEDGEGQHASNRRNVKSSDDDGEADDSQTEADTDRAMQKLMNAPKSTRPNLRHLLLKPLPDSVVNDRTLSIQKFLEENSSVQTDTTIEALETDWNNRYLTTVQHMVSEFTRRRTAKNLQHARVGRTGRIDMERLHAYKFADDVFKRVTVVPNGQSHGIILLVDGSSSMDEVFPQVIEQVILLAHFAVGCNIPMEAYMFTDRWHGRKPGDMGLNTVNLIGNSVGLYQLVNTNVNRRQFKAQLRFLHAFKLRGKTTRRSLGGTPLYGSLLLFERHVERFKRMLRLEKVTAFVLTDGGDTDGLMYQTQTINQTTGKPEVIDEVFSDSYGGSRTRYTYGNETRRWTAAGIVLRDTVTKKNFMCAMSNGAGGYEVAPNAIQAALFDVIKARHDVRVVNMFLVDTVANAEVSYESIARTGDMPQDQLDAMRASLTNDHQYVVPNGLADLSLVVLAASLNLDAAGRFANVDTKGMTTEQIGQAFIAHNQKAKANRVFVNTLMPFIA